MTSAAAGEQWMNEVCRKLSRAIGCELSFDHSAETAEISPTPASSSVTPDSSVTPGSSVPASHVIWQKPLHDGEEIAGHLRLRAARHDAAATLVPAERPVDTAHAVDTATVFAELLERVVSIERQLQSLDVDVVSGELPPGPAVSVSPAELVRRQLLRLQDVTACWGTAFFLKTESGYELQLRQSTRTLTDLLPHPVRPLADSPDEAAMTTGHCIVRNDHPDGERWLPEGCFTALVLPVQTADGSLGTVWCLERRQKYWQNHEIRRSSRIARELAHQLERAALLNESEARRQLKQELAFASLQHPGKVVGQLPPDSGLEIAIRTASVSELGGDLCEIWPLNDGRTFLAIGDATGHSVPAALIMAVARGSLRTLLGTDLTSELSPERITAQLNRALYSVTRGEQFLTFICGIYDRQRRLLTYTNGGHPPPWIIRNRVATAFETHGILPGVLPESKYQSTELALQPGDWVVAYTDGISEALSQSRELFRPDGILRTIGTGDWQDAASLADAIWHAVSAHRNGRPAVDDQTLLVLRITG